jgi:thiol-disulfide isomerase/thioredoxin
MKVDCLVVKVIFGLLMGILNLSTLSAQQQVKFTPAFESNLNPLSFDSTAIEIGDKLPDLEFDQILNFKDKRAKLSDFRGKLVLIDFWATWCAACIAHLPKLESLQTEFKDQLQVLLVNSERTGDDQKKVEAFFEKRRRSDGEKFQLPTIIQDVVLAKLFPHTSIPHYAWVDKDGIVRAITSSKYVTAANIRVMIEKGDLGLPIKQDLDTKGPLFLSEDLRIEDIVHHSILIKGKIDGLPSGEKLRKNGDVVVGKAIMNEPILGMFKKVTRILMNDYYGKRICINVNDVSKLILDTSKSTKDDWYKENVYTYELILPINESHNLDEYMLEDLNRYSEYHAEIKRIKTKCLTLVRTSQRDKLRSKGGKPEYRLSEKEKPYMKNLPITFLVSKLNNISGIDLLIMDETNYKEKIDIAFNKEFEQGPNSYEGLIKELNRYDLTIVEAMRTLEVLMITDKKQQTNRSPNK